MWLRLAVGEPLHSALAGHDDAAETNRGKTREMSSRKNWEFD
jgi:hypothetical protein